MSLSIQRTSECTGSSQDKAPLGSPVLENGDELLSKLRKEQERLKVKAQEEATAKKEREAARLEAIERSKAEAEQRKAVEEERKRVEAARKAAEEEALKKIREEEAVKRGREIEARKQAEKREKDEREMRLRAERERSANCILNFDVWHIMCPLAQGTKGFDKLVHHELAISRIAGRRVNGSGK